MAGGDDVCELAKLYGPETHFIDVDISPLALEIARRATSEAGVYAEYIEGNATDLDIPDESVDGFVLSAVLHEVYSYAEDGKNVFIKTMQQAYRKTSIGGCIYISDFAAPRINDMIDLHLKSHSAAQFIDYFIKNFRKFNDVTQHDRKPIAIYDSRYAAPVTSAEGLLQLNPALVSEILWHYKHYKKSFIDQFGNKTDPEGWKEINEVYLPPVPLWQGDQSMPIDTYADAVTQICQKAEALGGYELKCVSARLTPQQPDTIDMLNEHFLLAQDSKEVNSKGLMA